ncbi:MAG: hypothetical protein AAF939_06855 [Planctomycetota bacterium]
MEWLSKISITCFVASYLVVLALEISRIFFAAKYRPVIRFGFAVAGLFAHSVYMVWQRKLELGSDGIWLNSWFGWCLTTAWIIGAAYLWISIRKPMSMMGLFLLPVLLTLIWTGQFLGNEDPFLDSRAKSIWGMIHGISLSLGTAVIALGFVFGIVYLVHAKRLKNKKLASNYFRLPSLEWLQRSCESSIIISTLFFASGFLSGIALNVANQAIQSSELKGTISWADPVVWSSGVLFLWLLAISVFSAFYQPARQGRKVAYLVVTSFIFFAIELMIVFLANHAVHAVPAAMLFEYSSVPATLEMMR